ncbi:MAG: DDE-type integrase/transposase/recombinase [Cyanobium sp.]
MGPVQKSQTTSLAAWIDLLSRRVVGWKLDHRMDAAQVIEVLKRALGHRLAEPKVLLIHTDQGSQYRTTDYRILLRVYLTSPQRPQQLLTTPNWRPDAMALAQ